MKNFQMIYMDGYDEVRNIETQEVIFSTKTHINSHVIDEVINIWNQSNDLVLIDEYLLDEELCNQEERELIFESIFIYLNPNEN